MQPITLEYGTIYDTPMIDGQFTSNKIRFGAYVIDHYDLMRFLDKEKIYAVQRLAPEPIYYEWDNLESFFRSDVDRLIKVYQKEGLETIFDALPAPWQ